MRGGGLTCCRDWGGDCGRRGWDWVGCRFCIVVGEFFHGSSGLGANYASYTARRKPRAINQELPRLRKCAKRQRKTTRSGASHFTRKQLQNFLREPLRFDDRSVVACTRCGACRCVSFFVAVPTNLRSLGSSWLMVRSLRSVVRAEAGGTVAKPPKIYLTIEDHPGSDHGRFNHHPVPVEDDKN